MKKKNTLSKIIITFALFSVGASLIVYNNVKPKEVEATQHTSNFALYSYSGSYYNSINFNASGGMDGDLRKAITTLIYPKGWYTYSGQGETHLATQLQYADEDPTNSANMIYLYTRDSVKKNSASSWNREHCWPQSLSNSCWGESKAGTDILHIRPTYESTNSSRSNDKYCDVGKTNPRTMKNTTMVFGYGSGNQFEPLDAVKGDVARIIMYTWTAYKNYYSNLPSITNVFESYDTLLKWHTQDKPDVLEGNRNDYCQLTSIQKNRNPFVDHPELAWKIFGDQASTSIKNACVEAYPADGYDPDPDPQPGEDEEATVVDLSYTGLTSTGTLISADDALEVIGQGDEHVTAVEVSTVYNGSGSGGGTPNTAGMLKTGTTNNAGSIKLTLDGLASKVEILCHDFYKKSSTYPTNSNTISVNGSAEQLTPYTTDMTFDTLTFNLTNPSNVVTIATNNRVLIKNIKITYVDAEKVYYTVNFNSNGGSSVESQTILEGKKVSEPVNPTKDMDENYTYPFAGWYSDSSFNNLYNFETPVTSDLTLYAKYTPTPIAPDDYLCDAKSSVVLNGEEASTSSVVTNSVTFSDVLANKANIDTNPVIFGGVTLTGELGTHINTKPTYYDNGSALRIYAGNVLTFTCDSTMSKIVFTFSEGSNSSISSSDATFSSNGNIWSCSSDEVVFNVSGSARISSVSVTCGGETIAVSNVSLTFKGAIPKSAWNAIDTKWGIDDYGIMIFRTRIELDDIPSVKNVFNTNPANVLAVNSAYGMSIEENGNNYELILKVNISAANYDMYFCSAPYIVANDEYFFFDEMQESVESLASYHLENGGSNLSDAALEQLLGD